MDSGSGLDPDTGNKGKGSGGGNCNGERKFGAFFKRVEPFLPKKDLNPRDLRSWAKKTGFVSDYSGETSTSTRTKFGESSDFDLRKGRDQIVTGSSHKTEIDPILGRKRPEIEHVTGSEPGFREEEERRLNRNEATSETENEGGKINKDLENGFYYPGGGGESSEDGQWPKPIVMKFGLRDNPGFVPLIYYGLQHYLSLVGSLVFIPLVIVPAMDGSDKDTASVISTMLLLTGVTTILHSYFGTRLPLVQGSSFVYLAPVLVIINSEEFRNLTEHKFQDTMRELQGAIIVGSLFQCILGSSGLMSLLLRFINPVVVAPTVAAVGLAFFSYGFPQAGTCVEISVPLILLLLIFTLYLRGVSVFGHRLFRIYAVPLSALIIWTYAFFLTVGGAYDYRGCNADIPSSNILIDECKKHVYTMKHCRTDASNAWRTASWIRIPYPFQWGFPNFHMKTSIIMIFVSLVASVDSVGTYHSSSMLVNAKRPTRGIVSRGIALEGFCSLLAGIWGSGTGSTTLTENIHTINITKVASRRALAIGAMFLIVLSFLGKLGAILASIPQALAASVLCFIWALTVALGLSNLRYTQTASFRNITIVGVSLFLGLSIPAYFQQYQPLSSLILPSYYLPFGAASSGPFQTA
ncbi:nucleobase-ascorbate transporter 11 isoform X2 [Arabidopsis lyrata subsp. lyrata]|uniref:nucleobase-ascorbate transporter 11 isoform X2 n=1 Tax=Arabidopsis lyrata subsp. lyrata TaxID=81972 RepID=UPI000A29C849|nr:nucleobase-ascorbate transporter 11 isoform X2 [Arabidopsis lyrata subsp. lyrata]|eukprot:XP_020872845.1 nucleobase-ascorbate transporter 11 isoform X2 [Arabidopsis lyrata subsp. lyrata]